MEDSHPSLYLGLYHCPDVVAQVRLGQDAFALLVNHLSLRVQHVVIFEQMLADVKVVPFDLPLRVGNRPGHDPQGDGDVVFVAQSGRKVRDPASAKAPHQVILQREIKGR